MAVATTTRMASGVAKKSVQVLILVRDERILLVRHATGPFAGRFTGILGEKGDAESLEDACIRHVHDFLGIKLSPEQLRLRAVFDFIEFKNKQPSTDGEGSPSCFSREHEFVVTMEDECITPTCGLSSVVPEWFDVQDIPFELMPADDAIWYPPVLKLGHCCSSAMGIDETVLLKGVFGFIGHEMVLRHMYIAGQNEQRGTEWYPSNM